MTTFHTVDHCEPFTNSRVTIDECIDCSLYPTIPAMSVSCSHFPQLNNFLVIPRCRLLRVERVTKYRTIYFEEGKSFIGVEGGSTNQSTESWNDDVYEEDGEIGDSGAHHFDLWLLLVVGVVLPVVFISCVAFGISKAKSCARDAHRKDQNHSEEIQKGSGNERDTEQIESGVIENEKRESHQIGEIKNK